MINAGTVVSALGRISRSMSLNRDRLIDLDARNGDGDLGISMADGFAAAEKAAAESGRADIGRLLILCGSAFNEAAPSTLGTIVSFAFMGMGRHLKGRTEIAFADFADAFEKGIQNIMDKAGSSEGEKTILDSLCPAARRYRELAEDPASALREAAAAAEAGCRATEHMAAVHGRAARYPGGSVGLVDAGAAAGALIVQAIAGDNEGGVTA